MAPEHLAHLRLDADRFAAAAQRDLSAPVASCPGWTVADLVVHLGGVHRWAAQTIKAKAFQGPPPRPDEGVDPLDWYREGAAAIADLLSELDPAAECWNFTRGPQDNAFWIRRLVRLTPDALEVERGHAKCDVDVAVRGTASDLLLWAWGRVPTDGGTLEVLGDPAVAALWQQHVNP
jgi:hypothetical protein